jgi:hypothetical protein
VGHQILSDGWSGKLYFQELEQAYEAILRGESVREESERLQYGDYAAWERKAFGVGSRFRARTVEWWNSKLSGVPPRFSLPFERGFSFRRRRANPSDGVVSRGLESGLIERLDELARRESTTRFAIGLAAFAALLSEASKHRRVVIGTHVAGRNDWDLQNVHGIFACLVPLSLEYDPAATFSQWLGVIRKEIVEAQANAHLSPEEVWKDLHAAGVALAGIKVIFGGPSVPLPDRFGDMEFSAHDREIQSLPVGDEREAAMPWGFTFQFDLNHREHPCKAAFDARLYDRAKVSAFMERYVRLLERLLQNPDRPMGEILREVMREVK